VFEAMTYENIMNDMLSRVTSDIDKREGSIIYDALAPCALHLSNIYFYLDTFVDLVSGDTAVGEYLDKVVADYGITRKTATYAVRKINTSGPVNIGTRWGTNGIVYTVTSLVSTGVYSAICGTAGNIGNLYSGALENIDNVFGITATLGDITTSGEDEETDDALRERFYSKVQSTSSSGNVADYKNWALSVSGVGKAKVFPLWNGAGTVKVLIVNSNMEIDEPLETTVATFIETVRPIGATVTVDSPTGLTIGVTANIILDGTKTLADVKTAFTAALTAYLKETVFDTYTVSYAKVGSLLLAVEGVQDYNTLQVNGGAVSITLTEAQMPITGTITLTEV
jgi:uncharacterized phage protein gp47/JayE